MEVEQVDISRLRENSFNREIFDDLPTEIYEGLKADIRLNGIKTPLEITTDYLIVSGHQRYRIALELGFKTIPCIMSFYSSDDEIKERLIKDNLLRRQLNDIERAKAGLVLEEIERKRAKERSLTNLKPFASERENFPTLEGESGRVRDIIAKQVGFGSGKQYEKVKIVVEKGDKKTIEAVKNGELSPHKAYTNIRREERRIQLQEKREEAIAFLEDKEGLLGEFKPGDCREVLKMIPDQSIDFIFADPPYFLSEGISNTGGGATPIVKGDWDIPRGEDEKYEFNYEWLKEAMRVLKDSGTIIVSGTYHNIFAVGFAMRNLGFYIHNNIIWVKNPAPNLFRRRLTEASEILIWARKSKESNGYYFDYDLARELNNGKEMTTIWEIEAIRGNENIGYPTQKPQALLERILQIFTMEGFTVLDPFVGSGTTVVVAQRLKRRWIGIDLSEEALTIARMRIAEELKQGKRESLYVN